MEKALATISGDKLSLALHYMFGISRLKKRTDVPSSENGKKTVFSDSVFETLDTYIPGEKGCWGWYCHWSACALKNFFTANVLADLGKVQFNITPTVVGWLMQPTMQKVPQLTPEQRTQLQERFTRYLSMVACGEIPEGVLRKS